MAGSETDSVNVWGADALLAGGHSVTGRLLLAGKVFFKGCHACVDQQQRLVVDGDKGIALMAQVAFGFKEGEIAFSDLVYAHPFHNLSVPFSGFSFGVKSLHPIIVFLKKKSRTFANFRQKSALQMVNSANSSSDSSLFPPSCVCSRAGMEAPTIL